MTISFGEENITPTQNNYLRQARGRISTGDLANILRLVITDGEILAGEEQVHPEWIRIYNENAARLGRYWGPSMTARAEEFFAAQSLVDPLISSIDPYNENVAFLLGAGASKPDPSNIPTVKELLPELLRRARRIDRDQVTQLADSCVRNEIDNIEDLLTAVQISEFCIRNSNILSLVEYQLFGDNEIQHHPLRRSRMSTDVASVAFLQDTLQVLFGLLSNLMLPATPNAGHEAIVQYIQSKPSTPVVTTNYDCCIDLALINGNVPFSYETDFVNPHILPDVVGEKAPLVKLHGSLNWFYCETCQAVWLINISRSVDDYFKSGGEYPIISVCNQCGGQRRGLLVPSHAMKFDVASPLQPLIAKAAESFEKASIIVVVGFSFADADLYISRMISKAIQGSNAKIVIIDPMSDVIDRLRRKFEAQIPGFDPNDRIVGLRGDCAEVLPQFLEGKFHETQPADVSLAMGDAQEEISETATAGLANAG